MGRFIWCFAGLMLALNSFVDAMEGPRGFLADVNPAAWAVIFLLSGLAWVWLAIDAARGRF